MPIRVHDNVNDNVDEVWVGEGCRGGAARVATADLFDLMQYVLLFVTVHPFGLTQCQHHQIREPTMPTHPLLRSRRVITLLGITLGTGLGVALAASPVAGADAIDDAWPYLSVSPSAYPQYPAAILPGFQGSLTSIPNGHEVTYVHQSHPNGVPVTDEWYTTHETSSYITLLGSVGHSEVTGILDGSTFPHVGTTNDSFGLFPFTPVQLGLPGFESLFTNSYLNDPTVGFADAFTVQGFLGNGVGLTNTFISDAAGVKDVLGFEGQLPFLTLFEFPAAEPASAASDLSQMMTDFSALF